MTAAARLTGLAELATHSLTLAPAITKAAALIGHALRTGHKVMICGNGGSAAEAQHFAAELIGRYRRERAALPAIALTTDTSCLSALSNDYGVATMFARQVEALAQQGDVLIALSTSGRSENVRRAISVASTRGCHVVAVVGRMAEWTLTPPSVVIQIDSDDTALIQEISLNALHSIAEIVEKGCE